MNHLTLVSAASEVPSADVITAGPIGAVFFVGLAVATFFLWRNLNQRLKRMQQRESELSQQDHAER